MTTTSLSAQWPNLDLAEAYVVDRAYSRTQRLMRDDTLVQMLSEQSVLVLLSAIYFAETGIVTGTSTGGALTVSERAQVLPAIHRALSGPALPIVNDMFVGHVATLVADAIFPEQAPGRAAE